MPAISKRFRQLKAAREERVAMYGKGRPPYGTSNLQYTDFTMHEVSESVEVQIYNL